MSPPLSPPVSAPVSVSPSASVLDGAGFFGKVTSHGDFVARRLPPAFQDGWDRWLQACIAASKQQLGPAWLQHYLTSPIWRFALDRGVLDEHAWAGVLMPSVDRVGRHFPLMIAAPVAAGAAMLDWVDWQGGWYDALEDLARGSLENGFVLDDFDAALAAIMPLAGEPGSVANADHVRGGWCLPLQGADMATLSARVAGALLQGHSMWWSDGSPSIEASLLVCRGMPEADGFAAMLDGSWRQYGWRLPVA